jgi:hypothetical protein
MAAADWMTPALAAEICADGRLLNIQHDALAATMRRGAASLGAFRVDELKVMIRSLRNHYPNHVPPPNGISGSACHSLC